MKAEIKVPAMGESISTAIIGTILKPSGSQVKMDEEILELETDKVNQILYAPQDGILNLKVAAGQTVKIGDVLGFVDSEGSGVSAAEPALAPAAKKEAKKKNPAEAEKPRSNGSFARQGKEAVLAEMMTQQEPSVELQEPAKPSAPAKQQKAQASPPKLSQPFAAGSDLQETRRSLSRVRKVIAERLVDALQSTAMLTTFNEVDMSRIIALRDSHKEGFQKKHGVKLGFMSFFVKAVVSALQQFPDFNSYIDGDEIVHREYYNIGIAVGTEKGLFVPVIRNCDRLNYAEIEKAIETFAAKVRDGTIGVDDLQGGGFTITNGGTYGSLLSTPILNPPQCGILGMHKIMKRPVAIDDQVVIRPMMYLALSYDHRIVDGKEAVSFLVHVKNHLEDPSLELLDL